MTGRRTSRGLVVLILAIVLLLLVEAGLVAYVFISPNASKRLEGMAASVQRVWSGDEDTPGLRTRIARSANGAYVEWVVPLWERPAVPRVEEEFTACVECHQDYATERKFTVYMDHPVHAELGVECQTCHPLSPHPNPPRPQERVCAECHDVDDKDECTFCHPPASLPHFYYLGAPKDAAVRCDVCHPKGSFTVEHPTPKVTVNFDGDPGAQCLECHQATTCRSCHAESHPSDWIAQHGSIAVNSLTSSCNDCHTPTWCATRCHAVTPTNPFAPTTPPPTGVRP